MPSFQTFTISLKGIGKVFLLYKSSPQRPRSLRMLRRSGWLKKPFSKYILPKDTPKFDVSAPTKFIKRILFFPTWYSGTWPGPKNLQTWQLVMLPAEIKKLNHWPRKTLLRLRMFSKNLQTRAFEMATNATSWPWPRVYPCAHRPGCGFRLVEDNALNQMVRANFCSSAGRKLFASCSEALSSHAGGWHLERLSFCNPRG